MSFVHILIYRTNISKTDPLVVRSCCNLVLSLEINLEAISYQGYDSIGASFGSEHLNIFSDVLFFAFQRLIHFHIQDF